MKGVGCVRKNGVVAVRGEGEIFWPSEYKRKRDTTRMVYGLTILGRGTAIQRLVLKPACWRRFEKRSSWTRVLSSLVQQSIPFGGCTIRSFNSVMHVCGSFLARKSSRK